MGCGPSTQPQGGKTEQKQIAPSSASAKPAASSPAKQPAAGQAKKADEKVTWKPESKLAAPAAAKAERAAAAPIVSQPYKPLPLPVASWGGGGGGSSYSGGSGTGTRHRDVEYRPADGSLHGACKDGRRVIVERLLRSSPNLTWTDSDNMTPLAYAVMSSQDSIVDLLLDSAAERGSAHLRQVINQRCKHGWSALDFALLHPASSLTLLMLRNRKELEYYPNEDGVGRSLWHTAAEMGGNRAVSLMREASKWIQGRSAIDEEEDSQKPEWPKLQEEARQRSYEAASWGDSNGATPLGMALAKVDHIFAKFLIEEVGVSWPMPMPAGEELVGVVGGASPLCVALAKHTYSSDDNSGFEVNQMLLLRLLIGLCDVDEPMVAGGPPPAAYAVVHGRYAALRLLAEEGRVPRGSERARQLAAGYQHHDADQHDDHHSEPTFHHDEDHNQGEEKKSDGGGSGDAASESGSSMGLENKSEGKRQAKRHEMSAAVARMLFVGPSKLSIATSLALDAADAKIADNPENMVQAPRFDVMQTFHLYYNADSRTLDAQRYDMLHAGPLERFRPPKLSYHKSKPWRDYHSCEVYDTGFSLLHAAYLGDNPTMASIVLEMARLKHGERGVQRLVRQRSTRHGWSALHFACCYARSSAAIRVLLDTGYCDVTEPVTYNGSYPLQQIIFRYRSGVGARPMASDEETVAAMELLYQHGGNDLQLTADTDCAARELAQLLRKKYDYKGILRAMLDSLETETGRDDAVRAILCGHKDGEGHLPPALAAIVLGYAAGAHSHWKEIEEGKEELPFTVKKFPAQSEHS